MATIPQAPYTLEQAEEDIADLRGQVDLLDEYAEIATLICATLTAPQPGTSTEPETRETWHSFAPLSNSWSVPSGGFAQYRITPQNELQISAVIQAPGSSVNGVTIATFPVNYRAASTHRFVVATDTLIASVGNGWFSITSGGVMQSNNIGASAVVGIETRIPLDL